MNESIINLIQKPLYQALFFIALTVPSLLLLSPRNANGAWLHAGYYYLGFIVINIVALWFSENQWQYFFYSMGFSVAYILVIAVIMPILIKILNLEGSGEGAMVFLFIIYHPVGLIIVMLAKWLYFKLI